MKPASANRFSHKKSQLKKLAECPEQAQYRFLQHNSSKHFSDF